MRMPIAVIFALLAATVPCLTGAQSTGNSASSSQKERADQRARAVARCKADRGVDCDTPQGLHEWELQERSRAQAMREGSRRGTPEPAPVPAPPGK